MPTFRYEKLVRDNIPKFHEESGHTLVCQKLTGVKLVAALAEKLHEETDEVSGALTHDELIEELADVQQIIDDLCIVSRINKDDLHAMMMRKATRKGSFLQGEYIVTATMPDERDEWVAYCRRAPEKYPEITETT